MLVDDFLSLSIGAVWLLSKRRCLWLELDVMCYSFDLAQVTNAHLLVVRQHDDYLLAISFVFGFMKVYNLTTSSLRFVCLLLAIDTAVVLTDDQTCSGRGRCVGQLLVSMR